jgi:putative spermidine/putrescine transport system substrate-binding protein
MKEIKRGVSRRTFVKSAAVAAGAASWPLILTPGKAKANEQIVWASYGGSYEEYSRKIYWDPFTAATGIKVIAATGGGDLAKLKAQVVSGSADWDGVEVLPTQVVTAAREGLAEPINYNIVNTGEVLYPSAKSEFWVSPYSYTGVIGYNVQRHPEGKHPKTWVDFWNVDKFPGRRGLRPRPLDTLEIALMADGVDPKKIYPLDVDRAFKSLDKMKKHLLWPDPTPQTVNMIINNEVDFTNTYGGRVLAAQQQNIPLAFSTEQIMIFMSTFIVVKGTKKKDAVMKLLDWMMKPELTVKMTEQQGYAPVTKKALEMTPAAIRQKYIPDPANPKHMVNDPMWWGEPGRIDTLTKRFKEWQLS